MVKPERRWSIHPLARYGIAVVSVIVALVSSRSLDIYLVSAPVSLFLCAVMFSAWFGGLKPGLLATVPSVLSFKYYFAVPVYSRGEGFGFSNMRTRVENIGGQLSFRPAMGRGTTILISVPMNF